MKKVLILICIFYLGVNSSNAQVGYAYRVGFKDKVGSLTFADSLQFLSQRALDRRARQGIALDSTDLPVVQAYIDSVELVSNSIKLHNKSKWMNQIVIITRDSLKRIDIENLSCVTRVELVAEYTNYNPKTLDKPIGLSAKKFPEVQSIPANKTAGDPAFYGVAYQQISMMNGDYLHDQGFWGEDMHIAVLDAPFKGYNSYVAFDSVNNDGRILSTYNFIKDTAYILGYNYDHGTNVLGTMAGDHPNTYVGTAPKASYHLFLTEDISSEKPIEEDNWVSAAEVADSAGVDIINSSLGYTDFVKPTYSYNYATHLDGNTTMIARAANIASDKGMFLAIAQGNAGNSAWHWMYTPGDADSVYSVGMVNGSGDWGGSGYGPNSDSQIKPDGMAMGSSANIIGGPGIPVVSSGSSFACPILAGSAACLWQALPNLTEGQLRALIHSVSDRFTSPNNTHGYGIPNFQLAYNVALGTDEFENQDKQEIDVYPNPAQGEVKIRVKQDMLPYDVQFLDLSGRVVFEESGINTFNYRNSYIQNLPKGTYVIQLKAKNNKMAQSKLIIE